MTKPIVVVGSINLDLVCTASRIPAPGETLSGERFQTFHGGKGANQAVAAARLGSHVRMIGKVGDDDFGRELRAGLLDAAINVDHVATSPGISSGVALISVSTDGQNSILVVPGANGTLRPADLERCLPHLRSAGMILTQLEIPIETVEFLAAAAGKLGVPLMLDPAPARALPPELLRHVTYLTPNETEALTLCGLDQSELSEADAVQAAETLLGHGGTNVILKMGSRGALVATADGLCKRIPAIPVSAVDSTAAGDAFNGGVANALMRGLALVEAVEFGIAVAALSVTRAGAQPAMPHAHEVAELLARQGSASPAGQLQSSRKTKSKLLRARKNSMLLSIRTLPFPFSPHHLCHTCTNSLTKQNGISPVVTEVPANNHFAW